MIMPEGAGDGISWWAPNTSCLLQWLKAAGFSRIDVEKTVNLTTDKLFIDNAGFSSGQNQTLVLVDAYV